MDELIRDVLAFADVRNSIEGGGILITGQSDEPATISTTEDLQNLLLQSYVVASPSGFLNFERVLFGEPGVIGIVDGGANSTITVRIENNGVNLGKLVELSSAGILGNPVDAVGAVQNINPEQLLSVLHYDSTGIVFDLIDHTYVSDFNEAAQDAIGTSLTDTASIDLVYNDGANTISANLIDEYAQDLIGAMFTDSASIDFTYNDGAGTVTAAVAPAITGATLLTVANETATFANSRRLLAGTGVTFDDTVSGARTVNATGGSASPLTPVVYTASQNMALTDQYKGVVMNAAGANNFVVQTNATVACDIGAVTTITQIGAGQTTITAAGGVTLEYDTVALLPSCRAQFSTISIWQRATNIWVLSGDLDPV